MKEKVVIKNFALAIDVVSSLKNFVFLSVGANKINFREQKLL